MSVAAVLAGECAAPISSATQVSDWAMEAARSRMEGNGGWKAIRYLLLVTCYLLLVTCYLLLFPFDLLWQPNFFRDCAPEPPTHDSVKWKKGLDSSMAMDWAHTPMAWAVSNSPNLVKEFRKVP